MISSDTGQVTQYSTLKQHSSAEKFNSL